MTVVDSFMMDTSMRNWKFHVKKNRAYAHMKIKSMKLFTAHTKMDPIFDFHQIIYFEANINIFEYIHNNKRKFVT